MQRKGHQRKGYGCTMVKLIYFKNHIILNISSKNDSRSLNNNAFVFFLSFLVKLYLTFQIVLFNSAIFKIRPIKHKNSELFK